MTSGRTGATPLNATLLAAADKSRHSSGIWKKNFVEDMTSCARDKNGLAGNISSSGFVQFEVVSAGLSWRRHSWPTPVNNLDSNVTD